MSVSQENVHARQHYDSPPNFPIGYHAWNHERQYGSSYYEPHLVNQQLHHRKFSNPLGKCILITVLYLF